MESCSHSSHKGHGLQLTLYNYSHARPRACVPSFVRACVGASDCLSMSLFAPRSLAAKMKIARLARGYKRQLAGHVHNIGLAARKGGQVACVLRRTRRLIPPLIYVLIYVLPRVTRRRIYRYARRLYASPILFRAPNVTQTHGQATPMRGSLKSVVILIKNRLKHVRKELLIM